jgi:hypothetical protein
MMAVFSYVSSHQRNILLAGTPVFSIFEETELEAERIAQTTSH